MGLCASLAWSFAPAIAADRSELSTPFGLWHARVKNPSGEWIAFQLEVKRDASSSHVTGALINDADQVPSSEGSVAGDTLRLRFDFYDAELTAKLSDGKLTGTFTRQWEQTILTRELVAERRETSPMPPGPTDLSGDWVLKVGEAPQQRLWRAAFRTAGGRATGTIIPVSGDWGSLEGTWSADGVLTLNRFDGINSRVFKATLQPDGTLHGFVDLGLFDPVRKVVAERAARAPDAVLAELPDPTTHTRLKDPSEPFRFAFPDSSGKIIAWDDTRFRGKVVVISIMGTWCPTCHEEAPFLQELLSKYRDQGLEIIGLSFEYTGRPERDRRQLDVFARRHGLQYPLLYGGSTADAPKHLSQLENFGAYPTTLYIGRDGRVRRVHAGFEGRAAGERSVRMKAEIESFVQELLRDTERQKP